MTSKNYPDLADIYAKREAGRSARAKMPLDEKFKVMDKLRTTADEFKAARLRRKEASTIAEQK